MPSTISTDCSRTCTSLLCIEDSRGADSELLRELLHYPTGDERRSCHRGQGDNFAHFFEWHTFGHQNIPLGRRQVPFLASGNDLLEDRAQNLCVPLDKALSPPRQAFDEVVVLPLRQPRFRGVAFIMPHRFRSPHREVEKEGVHDSLAFHRYRAFSCLNPVSLSCVHPKAQPYSSTGVLCLSLPSIPSSLPYSQCPRTVGSELFLLEVHPP